MVGAGVGDGQVSVFACLHVVGRKGRAGEGGIGEGGRGGAGGITRASCACGPALSLSEPCAFSYHSHETALGPTCTGPSALLARPPARRYLPIPGGIPSAAVTPRQGGSSSGGLPPAPTMGGEIEEIRQAGEIEPDQDEDEDLVSNRHPPPV